MSVFAGIDPQRLDEAGWGLVLPAKADPGVQTALGELLQWRIRQAAGRGRVFDGSDGVIPGETWSDFTARHGATPGPVDPDRLPYYLLLAGSPADIPLDFQIQAGVQYAVGRLHFDEFADYEQVARRLVEREQAQRGLPPRLTLFGPRHDGDPVTAAFTDELLRPLSSRLQSNKIGPELELILGRDATKSQLAALTQRQRTAVLLAAGHGLVFPAGAAQQRRDQGALLVQEFPGPQRMTAQGAFPNAFLFGADDVSASADLGGLLAVLLASYSAVSPATETLPNEATPLPVAPAPFVSRLAQRLLLQGATGVVGYAGRTWAHALEALIEPLDHLSERFLAGDTVGTGLERFAERYAEIATELTDRLEELDFGAVIADDKLAQLWLARENARNLILLGDPAARLPLPSTAS